MSEENNNTSSEQKQADEGMILMLFLFRGGYLTESNKLGHEIINLFKADNGKHYIYVVPWGLVNKEYADKISTIILARHIGDRQVEIIAKAKVKGDAFPGVTESRLSKKDKATNKEKLKQMKDRHSERCKGITYGGKRITDIYQFDEDGDEQRVLISYEVEDFRFSKPDKETNQFPRLYYPEKSKEENEEKKTKDHLIHMKGNMAKNTLKEYFPKENKKDNHVDEKPAGSATAEADHSAEEACQNDYKALLKLINDTDRCYWEDKDNSRTIENKDYSKTIEDYYSFIKTMGKEDDELVFSNLLYFYFRNVDILNLFFNNLNASLSKESPIEMIEPGYEIAREADHIDILIKDKKHVIVIENKIKSGINGTKKDENDNPQKQSQLSTYWDKANSIANEMQETLKQKPSVKCFIFVPNYNCAKIKNELQQLKDGEHFIIVPYSFICDFFSKKLFNSAKYINEFRKALSRHASAYPDSLREDTYLRFLERINELNQENHSIIDL